MSWTVQNEVAEYLGKAGAQSYWAKTGRVIIRDAAGIHVATVDTQHAWLVAAPELHAELERMTRTLHELLLGSGVDPEFAELSLVPARLALARVKTILVELDARG